MGVALSATRELWRWSRSASEECDDANTVNGDACTNACRLATCGDQIVQVGVEECDDGDLSDENNCTSRCRQNICGDGFLYRGVEQCDDGNQDDTDDCSSDCTFTYCGDGITQAPREECDDGNQDDEDLCTPSCALSDRCGLGLNWNGFSALWTTLNLARGSFRNLAPLTSYPQVGSEATVMAYGDPQGTRQLRLSVNSKGLLEINVTSPRGSSQAVSLSRTIPLESWVHIAWDVFGEEVSSDFGQYEDRGFTLTVDGVVQEFAGLMSGAWGNSAGMQGPQTLYIGARPRSAEEGGDLGDVLHGSLKHITLWTREGEAEPRAEQTEAERARALSPEVGRFCVIANWSGEGPDVNAAAQETGGRSIATSNLSLQDHGCLPRRFYCDNGLVNTSPCAQTSQNVPFQDQDSDGLTDAAELTCGLTEVTGSASSDQNNDGVLDHVAGHSSL